VWLLIGEPPRGLPIHQVTTLPAWLEANDPTWLHDNPVPEGRVGCENRHGLNQCAAANTRRQEEAFARLARAHQALLDDGRVQAGERPTQKALITRTKALCGTTPSADTVKRYLAVAEERGFAPLSIRYSYESSSPNPPQAVDRSPASEGFDVANGAALAPHVVPMEVMLPAIAQNVLDDILDSAACELLGIA